MRHTWAMVLACMLILTSCNALSPEQQEMSSQADSQRETAAAEEETGEQEEEDPTRMASYETEFTDPPVHFDLDEITAQTQAAARAVSGVYRQMDRFDGFDSAYLATDEEIWEILSAIGKLGEPAAHDDWDMVNPETVRRFYRQVEAGESASLGIYTLGGRGQLTRYCFHTEGGQVYQTRIDVEFDGDGEPSLTEITYENKLDHFILTGKGFLIFGNEGTGWGGLAQGFRVEPLGEEKRSLGRRYLGPLQGYIGHNILEENWDSGSLEDLSYNDVFEMLYHSETGVPPQEVFTGQFSPQVVYTNAVPGGAFESVMLQYFNVQPQQLRQWAVYDPDQDVYAWEVSMNNSFQPSWEVVDYAENGDGSLTLEVDAYSIRHGIERMATNYLTVMPRADGTFYYLANRLERVEDLRLFPTYRPRVKKDGTENQ